MMSVTADFDLILILHSRRLISFAIPVYLLASYRPQGKEYKVVNIDCDTVHGVRGSLKNIENHVTLTSLTAIGVKCRAYTGRA